MMQFFPGNLYSRKQVWRRFNPEGEFPKGGPWATGYVSQHKALIAFANINSPGRTGHDFPNTFNEQTNEMTWYGKPNAHSEQPTFRSLFQGSTELHMFARWNSKSVMFTYLGKPKISSFQNDIILADGIRTIKLTLVFDAFSLANDELQEATNLTEGSMRYTFGRRFERNPRLRSECINHHGTDCKICGFRFEEVYGDLGLNYCHVHHISPLSEVGESHTVCPKTDLIPVCPNCHAMLHKTKPALTPDQLREILKKYKN